MNLLLLRITALMTAMLFIPGSAFAERFLPDALSFESGDLIWPKKRGVIVPYNNGSGETDPHALRQQWEEERDQFTKQLEKTESKSAQQLAVSLRNLQH